MGIKLKLQVGAEAAKVEATKGLGYSGETPPPGTYAAMVKQIQIKETKAKDKMMVVAIIEFDAPSKDPNAKYNGFSIFHRLVLPESMEDNYADLQIGQINRLLDALTGDESGRKVFWGNNALMDDKGEKIVKLGKLVVGGKGFKGIKVTISTRADSYMGSQKGDDGQVVKTKVRTLRINDIFPFKAAPVKSAPEPVEEDGLDDEIEDEIIEDVEDGSDEADDSTPESDEASTDEDDSDYVEEDSDEDGYIEDDEVEEEPKPAPKRRRSAF